VALVSLVAEGRARARFVEYRLGVLERFDIPATASEALLIDALDGAWGVVAGGERYTDRVISSLPSLRAIVRAGVGYENVDLAAAAAHGVTVAVTPGANAESCADFTVALMLACLRRVPAGDSAVRSGAWKLSGQGRDLTGSAVGIVGLGAIGRATARRLAAFGCRLLAVEPDPDQQFCREHAIELMTLAELLPQVDVVTLHAPLTTATYHLIGPVELRSMRPGAILVNTARGALVDENAMVAALHDGILGGAALDTFEEEPLRADHPLLGAPNVVLSGHEASSTPGAYDRLYEAAVEALVAIAAGRAPAGAVGTTGLGRPGPEA
jgi:phosphoglycerate dehydrogenase-like enzyme